MLFTEPIFFAFFATVLAVVWSLRRNGSRKVALLVASYVFYAAWDWRFLSLILVSTGVDYLAGARIDRSRNRTRRAWLVLSLAANLGILGFFKYFDFFVESGAGLLRAAGIPVEVRALELVLPVGISFYTFQSMSYTIDVYRHELRPVQSLLDFALFVAFFPQLVAGPIVRARTFLPQLRSRRSFGAVDLRGCLALFLVGFAKKTCVADRVSAVVDPVFAIPEAFDPAAVWLAVLFYAVQIYCDFSGYTDMAIATAGLLGYELTVNFRYPYLAASVREFWRRWHVSLSTWLRDYLYVPLGGSGGSRVATLRNLMVTMLLGGLWHGAAFPFVVWGGLHGLALAVHRMFARAGGRLPASLGVALTFSWVCVAWIFFRAESLGAAWTLLERFLFLRAGPQSVDPWLFLVLVPLGGLHLLGSRRSLDRRWTALPDWAFAASYGAAVAVVLAFVPLRREPFVYFQF